MIKEMEVKLGDVFQIGKHRIMCGDSSKKQDVNKLMNGVKADLFLTDPPYGVSYLEKNASVNGGVVHNMVGKTIDSDEKSLEEIKVLWLEVAKNAYDSTTMEASYLWFACQGGDQMMMMMMIGDAGWKVRHELIWVKDSMVFGRSDYHYQHEPILYGWKKKGKHNFYGDRKNVSVLNFKRPNKSDLHPTSKPVDLLRYLLKNHSKEGNIVLDLFGGGGSTLEACQLENRTCYIMEISPEYIKTIIGRLNSVSNPLF